MLGLDSAAWVSCLLRLQPPAQALQTVADPDAGAVALAAVAVGPGRSARARRGAALETLIILHFLRALSASVQTPVALEFVNLVEPAGPFVLVHVTATEEEGITARKVLELLEQVQQLAASAKQQCEYAAVAQGLSFRIRADGGEPTRVLQPRPNHAIPLVATEVSPPGSKSSFRMTMKTSRAELAGTELVCHTLTRTRTRPQFSLGPPPLPLVAHCLVCLQTTLTDVLEVVECLGLLERTCQTVQKTAYTILPHTAQIKKAQHVADRTQQNVRLALELLQRYNLPGRGWAVLAGSGTVSLTQSHHIDCHAVWTPYDRPLGDDDSPASANRLVIICEESLAPLSATESPVARAVVAARAEIEQEYGVELR